VSSIVRPGCGNVKRINVFAALLLCPRSSPAGVGVGVGVGRGIASAADGTAKQATASTMKAEPKCFRGRLSEVLIGVFISIIVSLFGFWFVVFVICYLFPKIRDEVPENSSND
jgi:hypothetical protein